MSEKKMVIIVGDHPHVGRIGEFTGKVIQIKGGTEQMAEIRFSDGDGCFAKARNLMKIHKKKGAQ